eukprot:TRINITY_DN10581_c0_g1_i3.p5 TRINITY_DN10581_c0_g1~~TRINITY_DN10581_c0_g1_i3.p5  ORF type:complete len:161 (+),score=18.96 TRINITY_DN10581_c0_g1_i3:1617-2099(+)
MLQANTVRRLCLPGLLGTVALEKFVEQCTSIQSLHTEQTKARGRGFLDVLERSQAHAGAYFSFYIDYSSDTSAALAAVLARKQFRLTLLEAGQNRGTMSAVDASLLFGASAAPVTSGTTVESDELGQPERLSARLLDVLRNHVKPFADTMEIRVVLQRAS